MDTKVKNYKTICNGHIITTMDNKEANYVMTTNSGANYLFLNIGGNKWYEIMNGRAGGILYSNELFMDAVINNEDTDVLLVEQVDESLNRNIVKAYKEFEKM